MVAAIVLATLAVLAAQAGLLAARDAGLRAAVRNAGTAVAVRVQVSRPRAAAVEVAGLWRDLERRLPAGALAGRPARGVVLSPETSGNREYALAGVERAGRWLRLSAGRPPRACRAEPCEAVAIGSAAVPTRLRVRGVELRIVGRGWISPVPLGPVPPAQPALAAGATFLVTGWRARAAHELEGRF